MLLVTDGLEGMTIEGIAAHAGVGKTTIYRRWSSREEIVAAALRTLTADIHIPDTGGVRADLTAMIREFQRSSMNSVVGVMIGRLVGATVKTPELRDIFWENVFVPRRQALTHILQRGRERGELRGDVDVDLALDTVAGAILFQAMFGDPARVGDPDFPARLTHLLLEGTGIRE